MLSTNRGEPVIDKTRRRGIAGTGPTDIQRADGKYRHADARFVHGRQSLGKLSWSVGIDMTWLPR